MLSPAAVWKTAPARQQVLLASGAALVAAGFGWDVWTATQRHVTLGHFAWVCLESVAVTVVVLQTGKRLARIISAKASRRRTKPGGEP